VANTTSKLIWFLSLIKNTIDATSRPVTAYPLGAPGFTHAF